MNNSSFKDTNIYPILFMLVTCMFFVGILATMYRGSEKRIDEYNRNSYQKLVLDLLSESISDKTGISPDDIMGNYPKSYGNYVKESTLPGLNNRIFAAVIDSETIGYCVEIKGKGLWGSMKALVALSSDMKNLKGLSIFEQMETPGLGARISEEWFLTQFRDIRIVKEDGVAGDYLNSFELIPEGKQADNPLQIQQVTGATITTASVTKMLRDELNSIYHAFKGQAKL